MKKIIIAALIAFSSVAFAKANDVGMAVARPCFIQVSVGHWVNINHIVVVEKYGSDRVLYRIIRSDDIRITTTNQDATIKQFLDQLAACK
jgi:hypothetical protein